ncbi:hypothetical protein [uncultured Sphingomonas sp.]|uniref:hypothetical protein n=1 Tax=uncultured Sphingomonas sp. TaxID=158754 RepID=UPI0035CB9EEF
MPVGAGDGTHDHPNMRDRHQRNMEEQLGRDATIGAADRRDHPKRAKADIDHQPKNHAEYASAIAVEDRGRSGRPASIKQPPRVDQAGQGRRHRPEP